MTEELLPAVELWNMLIRLFNKNIEEIKDKERFPKTNNIIKIRQNAKTIFDPKLINFNNKNISNAKPIIEKARDIGGYIMIKEKGKEQSAINLYNELEQIKDFKELFDEYGVEPHHIYRFGKYLSGLKTQEEEAIRDLQEEKQNLTEENQTLTEENKKKDRKIERRNRKINELKEQNQQIKDDYEKKTEELTKKHEEEIAELNEEKDNITTKYNVKLKEIRKSMGKTQFEKEKQKIIAELRTERDNEINEYEEKIKQKEEDFEAWKKSNEEEQRQALKKNEEEINNLKQQIEDERKQAEEEKRNIKAEANRVMNENVAKIKNKTEERKEKEILEEYQQNQKEAYGFTPTLERYIKKKLSAQAYSLDEDELIEKIARDIGKPGGLPKGTDPKQLAKAIYNRGAEETIKHIKKIANLAILTGYNPDLYNKLPGDVAQEVQRYITDKINDDIRRKNIKYILPKDKPRWEHAMETKQLNPMLGRSAWRVN